LKPCKASGEESVKNESSRELFIKGSTFYRCSIEDCKYAGDYIKSEAPHYCVNQKLMEKVNPEEFEKLTPEERVCCKYVKDIAVKQKQIDEAKENKNEKLT